MFGVISVVCFAVAFILYAVGGGHVPWDGEGLALLGAVFLALHSVLGSWPHRP